MRWTIDAILAGRLAQLGPPVAESAARRMAEDFADALDRRLLERRRPAMRNERLYPYETPGAGAREAGPPGPARAGAATVLAGAGAPERRWLWGVVAFAVVLVLLVAFS